MVIWEDDIRVTRATWSKGARRPAKSPWTDEAIEYLRQKASSLSSGQMAGNLTQKLGVKITRSAVIGKCHREGIPMHGENKPRRPSAYDARCKRRLVPPGSAEKAAIEAKPVAPLPKPPKPVVLLGDRKAGPGIIDLTPSMCRWPIGTPGEADFHFCGKPKERGSYCEHHARIAFKPVGRRKAG